MSNKSRKSSTGTIPGASRAVSREKGTNASRAVSRSKSRDKSRDERREKSTDSSKNRFSAANVAGQLYDVKEKLTDKFTGKKTEVPAQKVFVNNIYQTEGSPLEKKIILDSTPKVQMMSGDARSLHNVINEPVVLNNKVNLNSNAHTAPSH